MAAPSSDAAGIRQVIRALREADHVITGGHDGEENFTVEPDASEDDLVKTLTACDESTMHVRLPDGTDSFVFFVLGNEPFEVVCDHGTTLGPVLDPLTRSWW